jgi:MFS family permease
MRSWELKPSHNVCRSALAWGIGTLLILATVVCFIFTARAAGEYFVEYEVRELADALILRAQEVIKRNTRAGIDLDRMVAFEKVLSELIRERQEIAFMALLGTGGRTLAFAGQQGISREYLSEETNAILRNQPRKRFALHRSYVYSDQGSMGSIIVGVDLHQLDRAIFLIVIDCLIAALVAAVIVREIAKVMVPDSAIKRTLLSRTSVGSKSTDSTYRTYERSLECLNGDSKRDRQLAAYIRLVTFLIAFSEELIRPFLYLYIGENLRSDLLDWPALIVSSTLGVFMVCYAAAQIVGPFLARRLAIRSVLKIALLTMSIGAGMFAVSNDWIIALAGRALTGAGFGVALIIGQAAILHCATACGSRIRNVGNVAAAMVAAGLCGPLVGGILADHFGYRPVLAIAFVMVLIALIVGLRHSQAASLMKIQEPLPSGQEGIKGTWFSRSAFFLVAFAMPIKIIASAVLIYLAPLAVIRDGDTLTMAGRVIALYFVGYLLIRPVGNRLLANGVAAIYLVITTSVINAIACYVGFSGGVPALAISMVLFGGAHALSNIAQLNVYFAAAQVNGEQGKETHLLGIYRLAERIGGIIGPPLCVLIDVTGGLLRAETVITWIAVLSLVATGGLLTIKGFKPTFEKGSG